MGRRAGAARKMVLYTSPRDGCRGLATAACHQDFELLLLFCPFGKKLVLSER
jgi:hypothetical protein